MDRNFASIYFLTREYGGPEEGGWWYNNYAMVHSFDLRGMDKGVADRLCDSVDEYYFELHVDDVPLSSVSSRGQHVVLWEKEQGENETTERPRYE